MTVRARVPNRLRSARERERLTREQLAVKAGVSSSTLYLAERGLVSDATLAKVAVVLGVDPAELRP